MGAVSEGREARRSYTQSLEQGAHLCQQLSWVRAMAKWISIVPPSAAHCVRNGRGNAQGAGRVGVVGLQRMAIEQNTEEFQREK